MRPNTLAATKTLPKITLRASEFDHLLELANTAAPQVATYLTRELGRAVIVADDIDAGAVRIGSRVAYRDDQSGRTRTVTLVWPPEADVERNRISVLTSVGAALIGLEAGQSIDWPAPVGGPRTLTVLAVDEGGGEDPAPGRAA